MAREKIRGPADAPYRIKDIVEKSGFNRETVHFYIAQGLLPPAKKTSHNMGWYSDRHLQLLATIRKLQHEQFLPLKAIKTLVQDTADNTFSPAQSRVIRELRRHLVATDQDLVVTADLDRFAHESGLTREELKEFRSLGFVGSGSATVSDVEILRFWLQFKNAGLTSKLGFSPRDMQYIFHFAEEMALHEFEIFRSHMGRLSAGEVSKLLDVAIPTIDGIFLIVHHQKLSAYLKALLENGLRPMDSNGDIARKRRGSPKQARLVLNTQEYSASIKKPHAAQSAKRGTRQP